MFYLFIHLYVLYIIMSVLEEYYAVTLNQQMKFVYKLPIIFQNHRILVNFK